MECGKYAEFSSRRELLSRFSYGLGAAALHALLGASAAVAAAPTPRAAFPNFAPRITTFLYLC